MGLDTEGSNPDRLNAGQVYNKTISGFLEPATEGSLQISGLIHKPLCHRRRKKKKKMPQIKNNYDPFRTRPQ
ncbi:hypothetical protein PoB_004991400 [Plakobranchus ocellatus]|uniref:Uncharacterized protein n=1 Tax=Plakobranchus ocellatus TaxID=259542 RepID=A0AAV4BX85_9GAST|nr:hypothetical protein PoB_004991400 [Plakobranchus ocellatus]